MLAAGWVVLIGLVALIGGAAGGFYVARKVIKKELKKNPPINEKVIRALYMQIGRKPTEAQIKSIMSQMNKSLK